MRAPNLEILDLSYCTNLAEIHEPAGFLDKLKTWYLTDCKKLRALPRRLALKSLEIFYLDGCASLENFPDIVLEMKCLKFLHMHGSGTRELLSSRCTGFERKLLDSIYKFQKLILELSFRTNLSRPICNSFDGCVRYSFLQLEYLTLFVENVTELDFLEFDYFPALR